MTLAENNEYSIKYINGAGNISHRNITVISVCDPLYCKGYLKAWCHLFRYDRILETDLWGTQTSGGKTFSLNASNHDAGQVICTSAELKSAAQNPCCDIEQKSGGYHEAASITSSSVAANKVSPVFVSSICSPVNNFSNNNTSYSLGHIICMAITAAVLGAFGIDLFAKIFNPPEVNTYSIDYSFIKPAPKPIIKPLSPSSPVPLPLPSGSLPRLPAVKKTAVTEITEPSGIERKTVFREISGIINFKLENIYESADTDHRGVISWSNKIYKNYAYIANCLALRTDEFLQQGGGDCEDWALFTCVFLCYWDIESYVGSFGAKNGTGHAVCLVPMNSPVENYSYYRRKVLIILLMPVTSRLITIMPDLFPAQLIRNEN